ncbi:hypothetical protein BBR01nite_02260 [Brevibacillus brevis]|nr:hypothetical protein BBR01nite_02260 [Brevibacillus brevis]
MVRKYRHLDDKAWEEASAAARTEAGTATGAETGTTATTTPATAASTSTTSTSTTSTSPANKRRFIHLLFIPGLHFIRFYFGSL